MSSPVSSWYFNKNPRVRSGFVHLLSVRFIKMRINLSVESYWHQVSVVVRSLQVLKIMLEKGELCLNRLGQKKPEVGSLKRARKEQGRNSRGLTALRLDGVKLLIVNFFRKGSYNFFTKRSYRTKAGRKTAINLKS